MNIVKDSKKIHRELIKRWKDLELNNNDIIKDASELGMAITKSNMSNYRNHMTSLTEDQLVFLCLSYCVVIKLQVGEPVIKGGKAQCDKDGNVIYEVTKYDRKKALEMLKKLGY